MKFTKEQINEIKAEIEKIVKSSIPESCHMKISQNFGVLGYDNIIITIAANDSNINDVKGQHPQRVNLNLILNDLELSTCNVAGMGGQRIYRKVDPNDPKEKYNAMKGIKIPFRMPKKELKYIYPAIGRFAQNWTKAIKENKERLMHQDLTNNYSMFD